MERPGITRGTGSNDPDLGVCATTAVVDSQPFIRYWIGSLLLLPAVIL